MFQGNEGGVEQQPADDSCERACTLCVVKPHIVRDGKLGDLLALVSERGFEVSGQGGWGELAVGGGGGGSYNGSGGRKAVIIAESSSELEVAAKDILLRHA